ncbi:cupin domain-containing protein [Bengtsoniella intestinalis]|uniref:cupin domain-containing protein n=1 Tax=Bengtsoniella intestinalis TaxID=3073143 RepID=UPI00391FB949
MNTLDFFVANAYGHLQDSSQKGRYVHTLLPSTNSPTVVHLETDQLSYVVDGTGTVWLNGEAHSLKSGQAVCVPAKTTHRFQATTPLTLFHIHIPDGNREKDRAVLEGLDYERD